jgi:hypothetical protein
MSPSLSRHRRDGDQEGEEDADLGDLLRRAGDIAVWPPTSLEAPRERAAAIIVARPHR